MRKIDLAFGVRLAVMGGIVNIGLAAGSYLVGCSVRDFECGVVEGWQWILRHPVFPSTIPVAMTVGFFVGTFAGVFPRIRDIGTFPRMSERSQNVLSWIVTVLMIVAFAFWGLPEIKDVYATRGE